MADKGKSALFNVNTVLSIWDPEFRRWAQEQWSKIPDGHFLKSVPFERFFGVLKGWAEKKAGTLPWPVGDVVEKMTDIGDFAIRGGAKGTKTAQDWMDRFNAEAVKRLEKTADPEAELERIKLEFQLRRDLLKAIEQARKEAEPKKEVPSIDWQKMQDRFEGLLVGFAKAGGTVVRESKRADKEVARQLNRFADLLERKGAR